MTTMAATLVNVWTVILTIVARHVKLKYFSSYFVLRRIQNQSFFPKKLALPCVINPTQCQNGGTCDNDFLGGYTCTCANGFTGFDCETGK